MSPSVPVCQCPPMTEESADSGQARFLLSLETLGWCGGRAGFSVSSSVTASLAHSVTSRGVRSFRIRSQSCHTSSPACPLSSHIGRDFNADTRARRGGELRDLSIFLKLTESKSEENVWFPQCQITPVRLTKQLWLLSQDIKLDSSLHSHRKWNPEDWTGQQFCPAKLPQNFNEYVKLWWCSPAICFKLKQRLELQHGLIDHCLALTCIALSPVLHLAAALQWLCQEKCPSLSRMQSTGSASTERRLGPRLPSLSMKTWELDSLPCRHCKPG